MIAVPIGDPAGVGPEIVAKSCALEKVNKAADVIVIGDRQVMEKAIGIVGADLHINVVLSFPTALSRLCAERPPLPILRRVSSLP